MNYFYKIFKGATDNFKIQNDSSTSLKMIAGSNLLHKFGNLQNMFVNFKENENVDSIYDTSYIVNIGELKSENTESVIDNIEGVKRGYVYKNNIQTYGIQGKNINATKFDLNYLEGEFLNSETNPENKVLNIKGNIVDVTNFSSNKTEITNQLSVRASANEDVSNLITDALKTNNVTIEPTTRKDTSISTGIYSENTDAFIGDEDCSSTLNGNSMTDISVGSIESKTTISPISAPNIIDVSVNDPYYKKDENGNSIGESLENISVEFSTEIMADSCLNCSTINNTKEIAKFSNGITAGNSIQIVNNDGRIISETGEDYSDKGVLTGTQLDISVDQLNLKSWHSSGISLDADNTKSFKVNEYSGKILYTTNSENKNIYRLVVPKLYETRSSDTRYIGFDKSSVTDGVSQAIILNEEDSVNGVSCTNDSIPKLSVNEFKETTCEIIPPKVSVLNDVGSSSITVINENINPLQLKIIKDSNSEEWVNKQIGGGSTESLTKADSAGKFTVSLEATSATKTGAWADVEEFDCTNAKVTSAIEPKLLDPIVFPTGNHGINANDTRYYIIEVENPNETTVELYESNNYTGQTIDPDTSIEYRAISSSYTDAMSRTLNFSLRATDFTESGVISGDIPTYKLKAPTLKSYTDNGDEASVTIYVANNDVELGNLYIGGYDNGIISTSGYSIFSGDSTLQLKKTSDDGRISESDITPISVYAKTKEPACSRNRYITEKSSYMISHNSGYNNYVDIFYRVGSENSELKILYENLGSGNFTYIDSSDLGIPIGSTVYVYARKKDPSCSYYTCDISDGVSISLVAKTETLEITNTNTTDSTDVYAIKNMSNSNVNIYSSFNEYDEEDSSTLDKLTPYAEDVKPGDSVEYIINYDGNYPKYFYAKGTDAGYYLSAPKEIKYVYFKANSPAVDVTNGEETATFKITNKSMHRGTIKYTSDVSSDSSGSIGTVEKDGFVTKTVNKRCTYNFYIDPAASKVYNSESTPKTSAPFAKAPSIDIGSSDVGYTNVYIKNTSSQPATIYYWCSTINSNIYMSPGNSMPLTIYSDDTLYAYARSDYFENSETSSRNINVTSVTAPTIVLITEVVAGSETGQFKVKVANRNGYDCNILIEVYSSSGTLLAASVNTAIGTGSGNTREISTSTYSMNKYNNVTIKATASYTNDMGDTFRSATEKTYSITKKLNYPRVEDIGLSFATIKNTNNLAVTAHILNNKGTEVKTVSLSNISSKKIFGLIRGMTYEVYFEADGYFRSDSGYFTTTIL